MTKLACRYGVDPIRPEKGVIVEHATDDERIVTASHPGCLYLEVPEAPEAWGRFGPAPALLGDAPTKSYPDNPELDAADVPGDHYLRRVAGLPMPCNRRQEDDRRPWAAPDLTPEVARLAKRLEVAAAFAAAEVGGYDSPALGGDGPHRYPSDADALAKLQLAALAALSGQGKPGWTATLRCAHTRKETVDGVTEIVVGAFVGVPHAAKEVHAVLADCQAFADAVHAERDAVEARIVGAEAVSEILAIARG